MSWQNLINRNSSNTKPAPSSSLSPNGSVSSTISNSRLPRQLQSSSSSLAPPSSSSSSSALFPAANSPQRASSFLASKRTPRHKVRLEPGHSPLDWAALKSSGTNLRNIEPSQFPMRVTRDELKRHRARDDCWTIIKGRVYNITPYLKFHPGGESELMKCAGIDGTFLFNKYHAWVNAERILDACFIGFYVP